ncbi:amidohydrolase family protein [Actinosynnema mirum]|uniref:Amidohydrolase n=1 Tax=Actinosynnema mirum (strain ATCC 29888 / DSM 43827 / JCM 3225 / NBRC 14064 / NCIMB 13271 / NRRL B-12336 / IMRU 3971 / 101) TaxID=446462 RepID=C6WM95_ACTMD|nr:amidohydrolase family protein [Actinosynnema mirum]ACU34829.1 amidohydrolase [Actinosynnema mirum DSM 43827]
MRTAITRARVFDGHALTEPRTVVLDGPLITADTTTGGARVVDARGAVLLPGLVDAHVHVTTEAQLTALRDHGVTTALDMAAFPITVVDALRSLPGLPEIRTAGVPAAAPGGHHARVPGFPPEAEVAGPADADAFVAARLAEGSDHLKIVLEGDLMPVPTVVALVAAAHARGLLVVAHTADPAAVAIAAEAGVDVLTHLPLGAPLDPAPVAALAGRVVVPTLTMMEGAAERAGAPQAFAGTLASAGALHRAGVPLLAGTDANDQPAVPFSPEHGPSLHHELELLVAAGLTPVEALNAATTRPAGLLGLPDRGAVRPGLRADLVLVDGDPLADIADTRAITRVWSAGVEHVAA